MRANVHIQVFFFKGCPHGEPTIDLVRRVAITHGVLSTVETVEIRSADEAVRSRFLGSPTVRVNGLDVDPDARGRTDFAMVCRLYGASRVPPAESVAAAIDEAAIEAQVAAIPQ
jgi:hypothetical protein